MSFQAFRIDGRNFAALFAFLDEEYQQNQRAMSILDEYRRNAQECQRMAQNAGNAADKASWLRLAASWLGMIKNEPRRLFGSQSEERPEQKAAGPGWPAPSDEDSQASH